MIRSPTAGCRPSAVAAALSMSKKAKHVIAMPTQQWPGIHDAPEGTTSPHSYDFCSLDDTHFRSSRALDCPGHMGASQDAEASRGEGAKEHVGEEG
ncbi:hypothetical protein FAGAP_2454 [Fusarium agapanthi]|uniref:Uncharacterized protein n=1 Tax=Fusarium agapanthi TaxID=1803897 RepID=A0A9P5EGZ6_9HYPO|nr:hypothetical protein FAGAP_2454 [Fusarium agapanthi]